MCGQMGACIGVYSNKYTRQNSRIHSSNNNKKIRSNICALNNELVRFDQPTSVYMNACMYLCVS